MPFSDVQTTNKLPHHSDVPKLYTNVLLLLLSRFSRVRLCNPIDSSPPGSPVPGKNTGVGCHFLLQCMKVGSENEVAQSCPTLSVPMDCNPPGSSVHGIFQARVLKWGAIAFSEECSRQCKYISLGLAENRWEISWFALGWGCVSCVCLNCSLTWQPPIVCKDRFFPVYHSVPCLSQGPAHSGHSQVVPNEFSEASSWSLI